MALLHKVSGCANPEREVDLVFVHGLDGHHESTWRYSKHKDSFWPDWIGQEMPSVGVWALEHYSPTSGWFAAISSAFGHRGSTSTVLPLYDRALQVLDCMVQNGIGVRPIVFVCHSLGGLLVKEVIRASFESEFREKQTLSSSVSAVLFLATPHFGSKHATTINLFRLLLRSTAIVEVLRWNESQLRHLNLWYKNHSPKLGITTRSYAEATPFGPIMIVDPLSANPQVGDFVMLSENHVSISKPRSRSDTVFVATKALVDEARTRKSFRQHSPSAGGVGGELRGRTHGIPRELPLRPVRLFGRRDELQRLTQRLGDRRPTAVVGPAGFGKSTIAAEALHEVVGDTEERLLKSPYPDGVVLVDLLSMAADADRVWNGIANAIEGSEFKADVAPSERAREALRAKSVLLVFENGEVADGVDNRARLADILSVLSPQNRTLVLTRDASQVAVDETVAITTALPPMESRQLLRSLVGDGISASQLTELVEQLDGHPLALFWAGNAIASRTTPVAELLSSWKVAGLPPLQDQAGRERALEWLFDRSVEGMTADARTALRVVGELANSEIDAGAVAACIQSGLSGARAALKQLAERSVLRMIGPDRYICTHRLVYQYCKARALESQRLTPRLVTWLGEYLERGIRRRVNEDFLDILELFLNHAEAVCANAESPEAVLELPQLIATELVAPQFFIGNLQFSARVVTVLSGWLDRWSPRHGQPGRAEWESLRLCAYNAESDLAQSRGDTAEALRVNGLAVELGLEMKKTAHEMGGRGLGRARGRRGDLLQRRGQNAEAHAEYLEARREFLSALEERPDLTGRLDVAMVSTKLGDLVIDAPHGSDANRASALEFALSSYDAAVAQRESVLIELGGREGEAEVKLQLAVALSKAARALRKQGRLDEAEKRLTRGLEYLRALEASSPNLPEWKRNRIMAERELAASALDRGDAAHAERIQQRLLEETRALEEGDATSVEWAVIVADVLYELGRTLARSARLVEALEVFSESLRKYNELCGLDPANVNWQQNRSVITRDIAALAGARS